MVEEEQDQGSFRGTGARRTRAGKEDKDYQWASRVGEEDVSGAARVRGLGGGMRGRGVGPQRVTLHRRKRVMLLSRRDGARHRPYAASDFGLCSTGRHGSRTAGFKDGVTVVDGGRDALYA